MNLSEPFVRRPIMTTLVMAAILIAGVMGYRALPVSDLPNVDQPIITVSASLPGASPETMASTVATTLERAFSTISGVESINSSSSQGRTQITLQFSLDRDIDAAAQDVQTAISQTLGRLPDGMPNPPTYRKTNSAATPIFFIALSSSVLPLSKVNEYAETQLAQRISTIPGVAQVMVFGSRRYAVRVRLDPRELASRRIGINEVAAAIRNGNVNLPTGELRGPNRSYTVESSGQLENADAYRELIVTYRNGAPVRLRDLGTVYDNIEDDQSASWLNDTPAIVLAVQRQPGTNTIEVVNAIRRMLPSFEEQLPAMIQMTVFNDRSQSIRASVNEVKFTLLLTVALVVVVIFIFLRSIATTIIPSLALPMSIVGTFAFMYLMGFSIDNLSLMALTLSVGFVVDDAIVMLENIVRHQEMGKDPLRASLDGSREIGFTIVSITLSLAAVFIPVLFMGGLVGRLLHEFALTITAAILISGVVSLTLTPMLCGRFLGVLHGRRHGRLYALSERMFDGMLRGYDATLRLALAWRKTTLAAAVAVAVLTVYLYRLIPQGFLPTEDIGQITVRTEAAEGISFESMVAHQQAVARIIAADPDVDKFMSSVRGGNSGQMNVQLKPLGVRKASAEEVIRRLQPQVAAVPGIRTFMQVPPTIRIGGYSTKSQYQFALQSTDLNELRIYSDRMVERLAQEPGFEDVTSDLQIRNPQVRVEIDRDRASALGLTARDIEDALYTAYGSRQISTIFKAEDAYNVVLEVDPAFRTDPSSLSMLYVRTANGALVPLDAFATMRHDVGPLSINHVGQLPAVTISFNLAPGFSLGQAVEAVRRVAAEVLPDTMQTTFLGTAQAFEDSTKGLLLLLFMAVVVIYIVLGILYESFIHPITILAGLPSAAVGALATLWLFGMELNLYGFVGILLLLGIVKKNAIMMIDFALDAQRREGKPPQEAIYQGCLIRFRPIMMTTMAAMMGALPIAMGVGAHSDARRPLGLTIVGGLIFSQMVTLYITPVIYVYFERLRDALAARRRAALSAVPEPGAAAGS